jgi:hypothetical protein
MQRGLGIALVALGGALLVAGGHRLRPHTPVASAPQDVHDQRFDFGTALVGEIIEHVFELTNPHHDALVVTAVRSSCGCTVPGETPDRIAPGATARIPVTVHLDRPEYDFGQSVTLVFERRPLVHLRIAGTVVRPVPRRIEFGTVRRDVPVEQRFPVFGGTGALVPVAGVEVPAPYLVATVEDDSSATATFVTLALGPHAPAGAFKVPVVVTIGTNPAERHTVTVSGYVLDQVEIDPRGPIGFGVLGPGEERTLAVRIYTPYGDPVTIDSIEAVPPEHVRWKILDREPGSVVLAITMTGGFPKRLMEAALHVRVRSSAWTRTAPIVLRAMGPGPDGESEIEP